MTNNLWYDRILEVLHEKFPQKSQLTEALMDLLSIERESAYRRLRKDVMFTVEEVMKMAFAWNISLDEIVGINFNEISFKMRLMNYLDPSNEDLNSFKKKIDRFEEFKDVPEMEYMEISNKLPRVLSCGFLHLSKFQLFKWAYQFNMSQHHEEKTLSYSQVFFTKKMAKLMSDCHEKKTLSYSQVFFTSKMAKLMSDCYVGMKNVAYTTYIWDYMIFNHVVNDIRYFHSIYLITDEEKKLIKQDLYDLLDYLSEVTIKGCWPENGNNVKLYISYLNIDTNYSYYYSNEFKICRVHAFSKNEIYTTDPAAIEDFKIWMQLKKRAAVQIAKADEKARIEFFIKQRELIDTL